MSSIKGKMSFEALNKTRLALPKSEIIKRSEVVFSEGSSCGLHNSRRVGCVVLDVEKHLVESLAYEWIGH